MITMLFFRYQFGRQHNLIDQLLQAQHALPQLREADSPSPFYNVCPTVVHIHIYIYIYRGLGGETNQEIVSFRLCVRTAVCKVRMDLKNNFVPFPFSLLAPGQIPSLFPCEIRCSLRLEINETKGIQARSSESK